MEPSGRIRIHESQLSGIRVSLKQQSKKSTNTGIYLNWFSFPYKPRKRRTLKNLVYWAYNTCYTEYPLRKELLNLGKIFTYKNNSLLGYKASINIREKQQERNNVKRNNNDVSNNNNENTFIDKNNCQTPKKQLLFIILSYKGQQCEKVIKSFKTALYNLYQII